MGSWTTILAAVLAMGADDDEPMIKVDAAHGLHRLSPWLSGACIEDVNHEIYGGIYSQMIFGESFQEPARPLPLKGFMIYGGRWTPVGGELQAEAGDGPKLVAEGWSFAEGEIDVDLRFDDDRPGNSGLIFKVWDAERGADKFRGYEVSLESSGTLVIGRHRQNWESIRRVPCPVTLGRWHTLGVKVRQNGFDVSVDGRRLAEIFDTDHPLDSGLVGLRTWQRPARFRNFRVKTGDKVRALNFERAEADSFGDGVSGMWRALRRGSARGEFGFESRTPLLGTQSQRLTFVEGQGEIGVENQGLNRWGLNLVADKPYEGYVWARSAVPVTLTLALESRDGKDVYATSDVEVRSETWTRYNFTLAPAEGIGNGRFAIKLKRPGSVVLGHAFLHPGEWGRFKGLPDRKDVVEGLIAQGITVLRYGGSMVNHPAYRWKNMIGTRDRRPPTAGTWYPYSTNGWGIFDFLNVCEAAGFLAIPAVNMGETPADMADFIEYANGPATSEWGRKRAADGHPAPYQMRYLELGNEEAVNEAYWNRFRPIAEAIWSKDPQIILVVGDFAYGKVIVDPFHFEGGAAVKSLAVHQKILELARAHGREVWFDIHISTDHPPEPHGLRSEKSYIEQMGKLAAGAKFKVVIFEYNSGNHAIKRALSNALATQEVERLGDLVPIACVANCLQPDGQNDNAWDQGLLFLNPSRVWLQPPGYLTRMQRAEGHPLLVASEIVGHADRLSVNAKRSDDARSLVVQVVNWDATPRRVRLQIEGFAPIRPEARVEQLSGPLDAVNTGEHPHRVQPVRSEWRQAMNNRASTYTFAPHSFTVIRFEKGEALTRPR